jgi:hypothetical protein
MRPLGIYMAGVFSGKYNFLGPVEKLIYRLCGVSVDEEMDWREYAAAMLLFSFVSMLLMYFIERLQLHLPWNPQHVPGLATLLAWNTAASFTTNTNWQAYTTDLTMSYFTQMAALVLVSRSPLLWSAVSPAARQKPSATSGSIPRVPVSMFCFPSALCTRLCSSARELSRTCTPTR